MKKLISITCLLLTIAFASHAQQAPADISQTVQSATAVAPAPSAEQTISVTDVQSNLSVAPETKTVSCEHATGSKGCGGKGNKSCCAPSSKASSVTQQQEPVVQQVQLAPLPEAPTENTPH